MHMTLSEFCQVCKAYCLSNHKQCHQCARMISAACIVLREGICSLSSVFKEAFPGVTYHSASAKKQLMKMPLACVRIGVPSDGTSQLLVMEYVKGADYEKIQNMLTVKLKCTSLSITKHDVKQLMNLAQSNRERKCLQYAIYKSTGVTQSRARKMLGFEKMRERSVEVERCIEKAEEIRRSFEELALLRVDAMKTPQDLSSEEDEDPAVDTVEPCTSSVTISDDRLLSLVTILRESNFNWFEFSERVEHELPSENIDTYLETFYLQLSSILNKDELKITDQSREAFKADHMLYGYSRGRISRALNGEIVTDSESDDPSASHMHPQSIQFQTSVEKKAAVIKRQTQRKRAKMIAEQRFLERKKSKSVPSVVETYPDIGKTIENFVENCNVGADAWRRTGMLTFDGNIKVEKKCTYRRIQEHLEKTYQRHFSYGTVVQLCVARNRHRLSSHRYRGVAKVCSRRARRGFALKYNPDAHWSSAFYRALNILQLTDGTNIMFVNRDDASGFRLDTLTTHHQFSNPVVKGKEILTTYTDFVNRYPSVLQTTSYNFTASKTTREVCAGIVKAQPLFSKCPAQHAADFEMLMKQPQMLQRFTSQKQIECIRVDGSSDEGPCHHEVQYWWSERHLSRENIVTLVTTRSSGSSYLNRVELQNGCLARAHSNLFIPSTLHGLPINRETGKIDHDVLHKNLSTAIDVYIQRCNGAPCGLTDIHLYRGAQCDQVKRENLLVFLKGTKKQQKVLLERCPDLYAHFQKVWGVRTRHLVTGLPSQYIFFLRCCYQPDCPHPICQGGKPDPLPRWYPNGPTVDFLPLPVLDPSRPWGATNCLDCKGTCSGHYMKPDDDLQNIKKATNVVKKPPSIVIKEFIQSLKRSPTANEVSSLARSVLLPEHEIQIWVDHLADVEMNRKRGAAKARITRQLAKQKQQQTERYFCGVCGQEYINETEEPEFWIQCDCCSMWYHWSCVGVEDEPQTFICNKCF